MGKIKRSRHTFHSTAPKAPSSEESSQVIGYNEACHKALTESNFKINFSSTKKDIFKNVAIPASMLTQQISELQKDIQNRKAPATAPEKQLTKKAKRQLKRTTFLNKLEATRLADRKKKEQKKRQQTPIIGDIQPLKDALPTLEKVVKKEEKKKKPRTSLKRKNEEMLTDMKVFRQVLEDSTYFSDPFGTISTHLKMLLELQRK